MGSRFPLGRVSALLAVTTATALLAALPASAAEPVKGRFQENDRIEGHVVNVGPGWMSTAHPQLSTIKLEDGTDLSVYCVEFVTKARDDADMVEQPWGKYPLASAPFKLNSGKIKWVLHHSYPSKSVDDLKAMPGLGDLDEAEAISATQAAVWHFSDGVNLDLENPTPETPDSEADVLALYKYLTDNATDVADAPAPELTITPDSAAGVAGGLVGPFKVTTNGAVSEIVKSLPDGAQLTDKAGKELDAADIKNGADLYVKVPADAGAGKGTVVLTGLAKVETGRLFVIEDYNVKPGQSLIVADSSDLKVQVTINAEWKTAPVATTTSAPSTTTTAPTTTVPPTTTTTVAPTPQADNLPDTGASILVPALVGLGLVGAGAGALVYQRQRRRRSA